MGMDQELYRIRAIIGHQGPLLPSDPDWKGSKYNVQVEWETWEIVEKPLFLIGLISSCSDNSALCALLCKDCFFTCIFDSL